MKLLFASAEIYPFAKTGGLADVAQALPRTLSKKIDITAIMPLYDFIDRDRHTIEESGESFLITLNGKIHTVTLFHGSNQGVKTLFVYEPMLCNRPFAYGNKKGDYPDNDLRFGLFSKAIVTVAEMLDIDTLHLNDWHTALAALWVKERRLDIHTVFTIHNLAFQGLFPPESMKKLGIDSSHFDPEAIEFWGNMSFMKAAIAYSDAITTVSPHYAREILEPEFGCGLDGFLRKHSYKLHGILNGIDTELFDPKHDPVLPSNYCASSLEGKKENKKIFCKKKRFKNSGYPLFIFIGRFTHQKGLDLIIEVLPKLLNMKLNLSILGEGDPEMAKSLRESSKDHRNLSLFFGYNESTSHQMYAAADFLLMPSSFEPCGLNQLIALRYGTIPIVNRVGGLYDTVKDREDEGSKICGQGLALNTYNINGLLEAVGRAIDLYSTEDSMNEIRKSNMQCNVSFAKSAEAYLNLYRNLKLKSWMKMSTVK